MNYINLRCIKYETVGDIVQFSFKGKQTRPTFNKDCSCSLFLTAADSGRERERETDTLELLVLRWVAGWCGAVGGVFTLQCPPRRRHLPSWNSAMAWFGGGQAQHSSPFLCITFHPSLKQHIATNNQRFVY